MKALKSNTMEKKQIHMGGRSFGKTHAIQNQMDQNEFLKLIRVQNGMNPDRPPSPNPKKKGSNFDGHTSGKTGQIQ